MSKHHFDYPYFVRTSDSAFWEDRELVKTLIEMYQADTNEKCKIIIVRAKSLTVYKAM